MANGDINVTVGNINVAVELAVMDDVGDVDVDEDAEASGSDTLRF